MTPLEAVKSIEKVDICANAAETAREMAIDALKKQIPQKPIRANRIIFKNGTAYLNDDNEYWKCPMCTSLDVPLLKNQHCCHNCGQSIDWGINHENP